MACACAAFRSSVEILSSLAQRLLARQVGSVQNKTFLVANGNLAIFAHIPVNRSAAIRGFQQSEGRKERQVKRVQKHQSGFKATIGEKRFAVHLRKIVAIESLGHRVNPFVWFEGAEGGANAWRKVRRHSVVLSVGRSSWRPPPGCKNRSRPSARHR